MHPLIIRRLKATAFFWLRCGRQRQEVGYASPYLLFALAPATALAFETVDRLPFPVGRPLSAWPGDPERPWTVFATAARCTTAILFRLPSGENSDMVTRVRFGGRMLNRIVGRQRVLLEGFGEYYDFNDFNEIDHFAYGLRGDWLWEIGNQLDGDVGYARRGTPTWASSGA